MRNCCGLEVGRARWEAIVDYVGAYGSPRKSARQLRGTVFHKLRSMGHWYKEDGERG